MPNCFSLTRKGDTEPTNLIQVDEAICAYLQIEVHPKFWAVGWYDTIGLLLACGRTFSEIRELNLGPDIPRVVDFLENNYTPDCWSER